MPVNEILAPSYAIIKYSVIPNIVHSHRLYFNTVPTLDGDEGFLFDTYTDDDHPDGWHLKEIIEELYTRLAMDSTKVSTKTVNEVEVWSALDGENLFMGLDAGDYTDIDPATGSPVAAAYSMFVWKSALRFQFRMTFMDTPDAKPQRYPILPPPEIDDGFVAWFVCRSAVGFVTNDNYEIATLATINTGYNRKLARSYGRQIAP